MTISFAVEIHDESERSFSCDLPEPVGENGSWNWTFLQRVDSAGQRKASEDL